MFEIITVDDPFTRETLGPYLARIRESFSKWDVVIIDTERVTLSDTAAMQLLVAAQREGAARGREVIIKKSPAISKLMKSLGIQL